MNQRYQHCTIVLDGYEEGPTTQDPTHQRRARGSVGRVVNFTSQTVMKLKKVLIVKTAVESAETADTIPVGDDTDLLISLCYYADIHSKGYIFKA